MPYLPPIQQEQYPATDETQCVKVIIPAGDEFKALLAGLMVSASDVNNYANPESAQADGLAAIWDEAYSQIDWTGCEEVTVYNYPTIDLFCFLAQSFVGSFTYTANASSPFGYYMQSPTTLPSSSGWTMRNTVRLPAGDYVYAGNYIQTSNSGIADINLIRAGSVVATIVDNRDLYGAFSRQLVTASFTVSLDSEYQIEVRTDTSKNVSSTGYGSCWTSHHLRRVA